ncbi:hypothetical protein LDL08_07855 [Nonomuraea glycinis]|uniref:Uncharacterized protein n=1 Tax=Nonomuraea glycinis TaxID=2047744 RepID=A0A918EAV7_9ACTN|nr:hypothetical protein [Nonomuraea glycinis]MCA2176091.1 hypothetical protein [Nonomuraea glycinis]GGP17954.1 hypothetical protein GCM10012278_88370 [Nonomuraea glycinis]
MAAGAVVLTATPVAIAGTTSAPAQAVNNTDAAKQHNAARQNGLRGPDWDLGDDHCNDVNLRSKANNRFVSAEVD